MSTYLNSLLIEVLGWSGEFIEAIQSRSSIMMGVDLVQGKVALSAIYARLK